MNAQKKGARLGLRIFKTGLAATVSLLLCDLAHFEQPLVAVVAAVLSMERNMDDSLRGAMERLAGTVLGLLCGAILFRLSPHNAGLCGVGIIAVMYVCKLLKIPQGMVMSAFCMGVMLLHDPADGTFATAVNALLAAAVGIMLAVLINFILLPPNYAPMIFQNDRLVLKRLQTAPEAGGTRPSPPAFFLSPRRQQRGGGQHWGGDNPASPRPTFCRCARRCRRSKTTSGFIPPNGSRCATRTAPCLPSRSAPRATARRSRT